MYYSWKGGTMADKKTEKMAAMSIPARWCAECIKQDPKEPIISYV